MLIKERYVQLLLDLAEYYKSAGKHGKAVEILKTGLGHEPLHMDLNYRLLQTLMVLKERITAVKCHCLG